MYILLKKHRGQLLSMPLRKKFYFILFYLLLRASEKIFLEKSNRSHLQKSENEPLIKRRNKQGGCASKCSATIDLQRAAYTYFAQLLSTSVMIPAQSVRGQKVESPSQPEAPGVSQWEHLCSTQRFKQWWWEINMTASNARNQSNATMGSLPFQPTWSAWNAIYVLTFEYEICIRVVLVEKFHCGMQG